MRRVLIPLDPAPPGQPGGEVHSLNGRTMGTTWAVKLASALPLPLAALRDGIEAALDRVVMQMSTWEPASDLSRFNRAAPGQWQSLPPAFATVLDRALSLAADSGGAFDPAAGALVDLWGFGPPGGDGRPPSDAAIGAVWSPDAWRQIRFDREGGRAQRLAPVRLDFSAIAKGFAVDEVADYLQGLGSTSHLVEIGGELRGLGVKPDGSPWWVALERLPLQAPPAHDFVVALHGLAVATSGDYRRCFAAAGRRYSHLLDPRSGRPINSELTSVTVLHRRCMEADGLATALAVLGPHTGLEYASRRDIAALFVSEGETAPVEAMTPAFAAMLD